MAKKRRSNKWLYWVIGAFGVLVVFLIVGKSAGWIGNPKEMEVEIASAKRISITEKVSASGMVQPVVEVKLSPEVSGELIELNVEEGDSVKVNEVLAKVRPDNFIASKAQAEAALNQQRANLASSEASLARAEATFQRANQEFKRQEQLYKEKVISEAEWEQAQQNFAVAKNDLKSAEKSVEAAKYIVRSSQASLDQAQENLRRTTVTAPMAGIVSKLNVEQGETVLGTQQFQGTEIMRIADLNKMEVRVDVNENDIIRVTLGDTAIIDVDAYSHLDKEFKGVVTAIANTANDKASADAVTEFEVRIQILNSSYSDLVKEGKRYPFRPGMTASVDIITNRKDNVLAVPLSAVTTRDLNKKASFGKRPPGEGGDENREEVAENTDAKAKSKEDIREVVFVKAEGKAQRRLVKTGISDYEHIEILEGVEEGEEVVSGPFLAVSKRLEDGELIAAKGKKKDKTEKKTEDAQSE
ncbi:Macrolide-specific efflux protein MacA [Fulvivirga imtechensis AK7]|uniref:Macrolide-specific efflux protein MacA n=1 Tax=Fulvivirga imtechensis AK7 TaxID=1237149 RepID=L8JWP4_9BACT|nr:efflux RND transporter periplasmic adaptor subunit [Fulvivirga imtechensis]ELR73481.1 Macrolide-specific efflux protein MacA [Fulvivirga imtechensis AK7]